MLSETLALELENEETSKSAALVVGLVEETSLLKHIRQAYLKQAQNKDILDWAGKRLYAAQKKGYSTIGELCREFRLKPETKNENETHLLNQMQSGLDSELHQMQNQASMNNLAKSAVIGSALGAMSGVTLGAGAPAFSTSSSLSTDGGLNQYQGPSRIPPKRPFDTTNQIWLRRLGQDPDPKKRILAAKEIIEWNNPAILPDLANAYLNESAEEVQEAILRSAKIIYWNVVYWEMSQANTLEQAVNQYYLSQNP